MWDPDWLEEDYAWAAAYKRWKAGKCPRCTLDLADTTAMHDGEPVHTYKATTPRRCYGCDELIRAEEEDEKKKVIRPQARIRWVEQVG